MLVCSGIVIDQEVRRIRLPDALSGVVIRALAKLGIGMSGFLFLSLRKT